MALRVAASPLMPTRRLKAAITWVAPVPAIRAPKEGTAALCGCPCLDMISVAR
jgi:hypothetical protein